MMRTMLKIVLPLLCTMASLYGVPHQREIVFTDIGAGYRQDDLSWNVGAAIQDNILGIPNGTEFVSKLKWSDLQIYQVLGTIRYVNCDRIYMKASGDYGKIWHGHHTDKDFIRRRCKDNIEFLGSRAKSNSGEVFDLSVGLGYFFRFVGDRVTIAPVAGYSHSEQHLRMNHLEVVVNDIDFVLGPVPGLHSNYRARWYGPWVGADFTLQMTHCLGLYGGGEFHYIRFRGKGHWNLRPDFVKDFRQRAGGYGQIYRVGINYNLSPLWKIGVLYNYQKWQTHDGNMRQFFINGEGELDFHARWITQTVLLNFEYIY